MYKHNAAVKFKMRHADHFEGFTGYGFTLDGARKDCESQAWSKSDILNIRHGSAVANFLSKNEFEKLSPKLKQRIKNDWKV